MVAIGVIGVILAMFILVFEMSMVGQFMNTQKDIEEILDEVRRINAGHND